MSNTFNPSLQYKHENMTLWFWERVQNWNPQRFSLIESLMSSRNCCYPGLTVFRVPSLRSDNKQKISAHQCVSIEHKNTHPIMIINKNISSPRLFKQHLPGLTCVTMVIRMFIPLISWRMLPLLYLSYMPKFLWSKNKNTKPILRIDDSN